MEIYMSNDMFRGTFGYVMLGMILGNDRLA